MVLREGLNEFIGSKISRYRIKEDKFPADLADSADYLRSTALSVESEICGRPTKEIHDSTPLLLGFSLCIHNQMKSL